MEVPLQIVANHAEICCPVIDLAYLPGLAHTSQLDTCFAALQGEAFDLEYDSLLYAAILRLSAETHVLLISLPALCADSTTLTQIVAQLMRVYVACLAGENLTEEAIQYADVSALQNKLLASEDAELQSQYWRKIDLSQLAALRWPFEREDHLADQCSGSQSNGAFAPQMLEVPVAEEMSRQIQQRAQQYGVAMA